MKFLVAAVAFLASNTVAFAPAAFGRPSFQLQATVRPDTSQYVKQALEAVEKYGATSKEARLAWETVEEMDASNRQK
jgi:Holliday junction resolvase RusA-like endonuclease